MQMFFLVNEQTYEMHPYKLKSERLPSVWELLSPLAAWARTAFVGPLVRPYGPPVGYICFGVQPCGFLRSGTAHESKRCLWFNHLAKMFFLKGQLTKAGESLFQPYGLTIGWIGFGVQPFETTPGI